MSLDDDTMPPLRIPENHHSGLSSLRTLSNEAVSELVSALGEAPATARYRDVLTSVETKIKTIPPEQLNEVVRTLLALYVVRAQADVAVDRFTADLIGAMQHSGNAVLQVSQDERPEVQRRLEELLDIGPLATASKAIGLLGDHAHTFCDAKMLTDLRPIFKVDPDEGPVGFVVQHMLKIDYHARGRHEEFYVALDSHDVTVLREVLDRAEAKEKSLRSLLEKAGIPEIEAVMGE